MTLTRTTIRDASGSMPARRRPVCVACRDQFDNRRNSELRLLLTPRLKCRAAAPIGAREGPAAGPPSGVPSSAPSHLLRTPAAGRLFVSAGARFRKARSSRSGVSERTRTAAIIPTATPGPTASKTGHRKASPPPTMRSVSQRSTGQRALWGARLRCGMTDAVFTPSSQRESRDGAGGLRSLVISVSPTLFTASIECRPNSPVRKPKRHLRGPAQ